MSAAVAPFAWYGGKARLAERIVALLPAHTTYVEPFGGAASVLFSKPPAVLEVYNDIDSGLTTFFRALRDQPIELARALRLTLYSREEFALCVRTWQDVGDDVERARRWYVRCRQAFAASSATVGWGFEVNGAQRAGMRCRSFASTVDELERFAERFRRVQVEALDWQKVLERYDVPGVCFYIDPPYHPATLAPSGRRERHSTYVHELSVDDHAELVAAALSLKGSALISGYDHDSYRELEGGGFQRYEFSHNATTSRTLSGRGARTEVVWRKLEDGLYEQHRLWDQAVGSASS